MSVAKLDRPGPDGGSVGGMVVRVAAAEVEDLFRLMAAGLRGLKAETGLSPYADRC